MKNNIIFTGDFAPTHNNFELSDNIKDLFNDNYLCINLEGAITNKNKRNNKKGVALSLDTTLLIEILLSDKLMCGINNNHIMDYGKEGLVDTINYLNKKHISYFGAGCDKDTMNKIHELYINDKKNIILGLTLPDNGGTFSLNSNTCGTLNYQEYKYLVKKYKKECDYLIVTIHGGCEFITLPSPTIKKIFKNIIDLGADVIIGHHPHVPQGYEKYKDGLIFYSLGNFVFDLEYHKAYEHTDKGYFVELIIGEKLYFNIVPIIKNKDNFIDIDCSLNSLIEKSSELLNSKDYYKEWTRYSYIRLFPSLNKSNKNNNIENVQKSSKIKVSKLGRIITKLKSIITLLKDNIQKDMVFGSISYLLYCKRKE